MASRNIASASQGYREYYEKFKTTSLWKLLSGKLFNSGQRRNVNPSIPPSNGRCCFNELPPELRLMIYESVFDSLPTDLEDSDKRNLNALLCTNKTIFMEAAPTFQRCIQGHSDKNDGFPETSKELEGLAAGGRARDLAEAIEIAVGRAMGRNVKRVMGKLDIISVQLDCIERKGELLRGVSRWERRIERERN